MGKYLDILKHEESVCSSDQRVESDRSHAGGCTERDDGNHQSTFGRFGRFGRSYTELQVRCPDHVTPHRWQRAVEDGRRFLGTWGESASALGWTSRDLFGLHTPPAQPHPSYSGSPAMTRPA
jgi:hypothetical protein